MTDFDGSAYQARFDRLQQSGAHVHGEVDFVMRFDPGRVLDAGCGTGRVAIELDRRGIEVVGVDCNHSMLEEAKRRNPSLHWVEADLARMDLGETFDVVVLAGNVPLFCPSEDRSSLVASCAAHVDAGGRLVAGFQLDSRYSLEEWDDGCVSGGLTLVERWATWDRDAYGKGGDYAVSVHQRPSGAG